MQSKYIKRSFQSALQKNLTAPEVARQIRYMTPMTGN